MAQKQQEHQQQKNWKKDRELGTESHRLKTYFCETHMLHRNV